MLIEHGANIDEQENVLGFFPIHIAVQNGCNKVLKLLLDNGASLDSKTFQGQTALIHTIRRGKMEMVDILIENGADVNLACTNLDTPLHYAVKFDHKIMILMLLQNGASMTSKNQDGISPMEISLQKKQIAALKTLNYLTYLPN